MNSYLKKGTRLLVKDGCLYMISLDNRAFSYAQPFVVFPFASLPGLPMS